MPKVTEECQRGIWHFWHCLTVGTSYGLESEETRGNREYILACETLRSRGSVRKMDVPLRRIVGLIGLGLLTGALLKLIYQMLR